MSRCASCAGFLLSRPTRGRPRKRGRKNVRDRVRTLGYQLRAMLGRDSAQGRPASSTRIFPVSRHYEMLALGFKVVPAEHRSRDARALDGRQDLSLSLWIRRHVRL